MPTSSKFLRELPEMYENLCNLWKLSKILDNGLKSFLRFFYVFLKIIGKSSEIFGSVSKSLEIFGHGPRCPPPPPNLKLNFLRDKCIKLQFFACDSLKYQNN